MIRRPPRSTRTDTLFPYTTLVRSIPKMGASGFAYDLARHFGLKVVEPRPALVPLTLGGEDVLFRELSGVATPVEARAGKAAFREAALRSEEHTSELQSLMRISYAVFCLKKKNNN